MGRRGTMSESRAANMHGEPHRTRRRLGVPGPALQPLSRRSRSRIQSPRAAIAGARRLVRAGSLASLSAARPLNPPPPAPVPLRAFALSPGPPRVLGAWCWASGLPRPRLRLGFRVDGGPRTRRPSRWRHPSRCRSDSQGSPGRYEAPARTRRVAETGASLLARLGPVSAHRKPLASTPISPRARPIVSAAWLGADAPCCLHSTSLAGLS